MYSTPTDPKPQSRKKIQNGRGGGRKSDPAFLALSYFQHTRLNRHHYVPILMPHWLHPKSGPSPQDRAVDPDGHPKGHRIAGAQNDMHCENKADE